MSSKFFKFEYSEGAESYTEHQELSGSFIIIRADDIYIAEEIGLRYFGKDVHYSGYDIDEISGDDFHKYSIEFGLHVHE